MFPAASTALAWNVVVELSPTVAWMPVDVNSVAGPVPAGLALQVVWWILTVVSGSTVPFTRGWLLSAGDVGAMPVIAGNDGGVRSIVNDRRAAVPSRFPAMSRA